ncbi:MAG: ABC transporter permease [Fimbriimonadaceae bacterium]|nr:ABC transporter permease [Fimbriimonadaceae bacterium]
MAELPVMINDSRPPGLRETLAEIWARRELVLQFTRRSVQLRYKNSLLGVIWSLAPPLLFIFTITVVRKLFLRQDVPNYSAYLMPAMFAWTFFTTTITESCSALLENAAMVRRIYFPREVLPLTVLGINLVHLLIALAISVFYFMALRIFPWQVDWEVLRLLLVIPAQCCIILGIGLAVSAINVLYEDVKYLVTVAVQLLLYAVPLLYLIENVASAAQRPWGNAFAEAWIRPHLVELYLLNPFCAILVLYQKALLPPVQGTPVPALPWSWGLLAQTWLIALGILWLGYLIFQRTKWTVVERL